MTARGRRRSCGLALLAVIGAGCGDPPAQIEVKTYVGDAFARNDPELRAEAIKKVWETALPELLGTAIADDSGGTSNLPDTVHPPTTPGELDDLVTALRKGPIDELAGPAHRIAKADPSLWPRVRALLLAERKAPKGDYHSLLAAIGGDVPNRYGHFSRAWKKAHGHQVKLSVDWFSDLLALPRSKVSPVLTKVYRECVLQTALLRAATHIGQRPDKTGDVIDALLHVAYLHHGTFRDEVGRAIQGVGDEAVPHLLRASIGTSDRPRDQEKPDVMRANYAEFNIDRMDRMHPTRTVAAVREDPRLLAAVLHAYGEARVGEAAAVLLELADDRSPAVRRAAKHSFMAYVTGPAPKTVGRSVRLLGGGTGVRAAYLTYRERAARAIAEQIVLRAPELLEPPCEVRDEDGEIDEACEGQPLRHAEAYFTWLSDERARTQAERIQAALAEPDPTAGIEALNRLLAEDPEPVGAARIATFFAQQAHRERDRGEPAHAGQLYRKAAMLIRSADPARADRLHRDALLAEADVPGVSGPGRAMLHQAAAELGATVPAPPATQDVAPRAEIEADAGEVGGRIALATVLLFGLGLGFSPLRRRLLE